MLKRKFRLRKKKDFEMVIKRGKFFKGENLSLVKKNNGFHFSRFAFLVGKKVSKKAVVRNKIKRRLSEIIRTNLSKIKKGYDVIFFTFPGIEKNSFKELKKETLFLLKRARLIQ